MVLIKIMLHGSGNEVSMNQDNQTILWQDRKHHLWFPWSFTKYYIENDRLMIKKGFFSTTLDETLLYRIVDVTLKQTLAGKIFRTGTIILKAKVDATPEIMLENIGNPVKVRSMISDLVEESRSTRKVVGKEFYGQVSHNHIDLDQDGFCDIEHDE